MKDLSDIYSSVYMNSIPLEALKEFNIEYNITRLINFLYFLYFKSLLTNYFKIVLQEIMLLQMTTY
jgi:hypothetical protein